jgi:hypothetical protein
MTAEATQRAAALWAEGQRWDTVLQTLRAEGYSKTDWIRASADVLRLPLSDAKRLVHGSDVWRDVRDADEQWHDALVAELRAEPSRPEHG